MVTIVPDNHNQQSFVNAMKGQDTVVSTVSMQATLDQGLMIKAAMEAGFNIFIPSGFGGLITNPAASYFPHPWTTSTFVGIEKYLRPKSHGIEYAVFISGIFILFLIFIPLLSTTTYKKVQLYEHGSSRSAAQVCRALDKELWEL
jgi:hypothetical protein